MRKISFAVSLLLLHLNLFSQDCSCLSQFSFVKNYFESNNPAFQKIRGNAALYQEYLRQVSSLTVAISKERSNDRCNVYFEKYVALLKDHHSGIDLKLQRLNIDLNSERIVDSFRSAPQYRAFKKSVIDTAALMARLGAKAQSDVEGVYSNGGGIILGISETRPGFYTGVAMKNYRLLEVGHVLLELKKTGNETFDCVYHTGLLGVNFQHVYKTVKVKGGRIAELGLSKIDRREEYVRPYEFRQLDDSTNYLMLKSFDKRLKQELDSFYQSIDSLILHRPFLIIDLRDNGGGAEDCYLGLMKYIYTRPLKTDNIDVWVSPDNIRQYEESGKSQKLVERMKAAKPFTFIPQIENTKENWIMEGTIYPRKIAVLFNRQTASSAEGMITYAMQSDKVITMGENSGGYLGYGDWVTAVVPCGKFVVRSTTTAYNQNSKYEFVGIKPMYNLSGQKDWVGVAKKMLQRQNR